MKKLYVLLLSSFVLLLTTAQLQAQTWQWLATNTGSPTSTGTSSIGATALDGAGNTIVAGTFNGTVTFGSITLTSVGTFNLYVGRLNASGAWTQVVQAGAAVPTRIAVDNSGNMVVAGEFVAPTIAFGAFTLTNTSTGGTNNDRDIFVARLSPAGTWTQAVSAGGNVSDFITGLAVDAAGTATIAGSYTSPTITFGTTTLPKAGAVATSLDAFVARLSSAGTWTQAVRAGGTGNEAIRAMTQDAAGTVYVTGLFTSPFSAFGGLNLVNSDASGGSADAFVAKLSSAGTWTQAVAGGAATSFDQPNALAVDGSGNVVIAGVYTGTAAFGPHALPAQATGSNFAGFVARLSSAGLWTQAVPAGGTASTFPNAVAVDASGNATVVGQVSGASAQFGTISTNTTNTSADLFVARLNTAGTWTYALRAGTGGVDNANAVFLNGTTATVTGQLNTPATLFGFGSLTTMATTTTAFVARLTGLVSGKLPSKATEALALLPNPARGAVALQGLVPASEPSAIVLTDALGREVRRHTLPARATAARLDLTGVAPGIYVVRCGAASGKVVVE